MWADALPNLLIGLREGLEAGLVVSILLAAIRRSGGHRASTASTAPIWLGVVAAVVLALSFGAVLTFYRSVLPTTGQEALGGALSVVAVVLVTGMIFWMRRTARGLSGELRAKVADALRVSTAALALTAFLAVGREGIETALFLWTAAQASGTTVAPLIGAAAGIAVAVVLCVLLYRQSVRIRLDLFFNRTAILLIIIAGGVLSYGLGDLQDAGLLPGRTWLAFDLAPHLDVSSWWVSIVTGVTNLSPTMTWLQVAAYLGYLGIVLTTFVRAGRQANQPTADTPKPAEAPAPAPSRPPMRRRTVLTAVTAALVLPPVIAAALIVFAPGGLAASGQQIDVTTSACAPGWSAARTGAQSFTLVNKSGHTAEVNLVQAASQGIVAEIETLGPGTQQTMSATLAPGNYAWRCLIAALPTTVSATVAATGPAGAGGSAPRPVTPVSVADLTPPLNEYNAYVTGKLGQLAGQVVRVRADLAAGNIPAAQQDWLPAQLTWEQVGEEPYGSFGDSGVEIGAGPQGFPQGVNDPGFTGLRRLEYGLWHGQPASELITVADRLSSDIAGLQAQLPQVSLDPTDLPIRAHEILEDALRDTLTGQDDLGAGAEFPETYADTQADQVVLGELAALLNARDPSLLPTAYQQLDALRQALLATQTNGQWQSLSAAPLAQRQRVDAAIGAVLETLADVPDLLEVPAH
ncbi:MAG TPA: iron uptake transporter permease EfeU [Pseudonocardiaceae bacterium]|jgi:high-affinity iron transporter|nr:iron uptake transporter permease EfeU [Pseudonocardiaceae bacterium]